MIEVNSVSKSFGRLKALDNVSFKVYNGEITGYVGLNGAGKTTTIRIAVGVLPPDSGDVLIDGLSVTRDKKKASERIGWVPELPIFETDFKALDYYVYLAGYYGIPPTEAKRMGREALEMLGLGDALNMKLAAYSQGMKKRFALAVSLINDPPNFIFDEVLNGLDPKGIVFFRDLAVKFKKQGKAVLFSSHILSEVEGIADKVVFIHKGKIIGVYMMSEIVNMAKPSLIMKIDRVEESLSILEKYGRVETRGEYVVVSGLNASPSVIVKELVESGFSVQEVRSEERSLEEFFFNLIRGKGE
ncbi:ABC transporter ATP-binding protein [Thermosphaera chiliense]|uniref:ABC transporter ATP-binding protein n=1 Tax=Thermosphaera chiliense TaxID=3402707 RepID=A0A7M1URE2_9CREN|nr:ABC transporter ATP-binding protein [Thermosphaera aggregans]QOR94835.1 ABC transporter ATP-binding protein [Thermosphaera aggregans]